VPPYDVALIMAGDGGAGGERSAMSNKTRSMCLHNAPRFSWSLL
jgi:hypothetical protein